MQDLIDVVDASSNFVERVAPAVARFALNSGQAVTIKDDPFTIQLSEGLKRCPRPASHDVDRRVKKSIEVERVTYSMKSVNNPAQRIIEMQKFLDSIDREQGGDGLLYARATAPKGRQVILHIQDGDQRYHVPVIKPGAPVCITESGAPLEVLRRSGSLIGAVRSGIIKLMNSEQAEEWFESKAQALGISVDKLQEMENKKRKITHTSEEDRVERAATPQLSDVPTKPEDVVHQRMMNIVAKMSTEDPNARVPEPEIMSELVDYADSFGEIDYEFLATHATYAGVKKYANKQRGQA